MSLDNQYDKKKLRLHDDQDTEEGGSSQGGKSGQIEFRDFMGTGSSRDDLLSPEEKKRLLSSHKDVHELKVKEQKEQRDHNEQLRKGGRVVIGAHRQGLGNGGMGAEFKPNPALEGKVQFSGMMDPKVNQNPALLQNETNRSEQDELRLRYAPQHAPKYAPQFNPKPSMG